MLYQTLRSKAYINITGKHSIETWFDRRSYKKSNLKIMHAYFPPFVQSNAGIADIEARGIKIVLHV